MVASVNSWALTAALYFAHPIMGTLRPNIYVPFYSLIFSQLLLTAMIAKNAELKDAKLLADRTENGVLPAEDLVSSGGDMTAVNRTSAVSQSTCASKYARRHFFTKAESRTPSLLYTFPGSGNTWCRLLIEYGLGIYTGAALSSTYNYPFKKDGLSSRQARPLLCCMIRYEYNIFTPY